MNIEKIKKRARRQSQPGKYLLKFVQRHNEIARLINGGRTAQVICPEQDMSDEFIHLYVERRRGQKYLLHDDGYTLETLVYLNADNLPMANKLLAAYGLPPVAGPSGRISVLADRDNYAEQKEALTSAIVALELACYATRNQLNFNRVMERRSADERVF